MSKKLLLSLLLSLSLLVPLSAVPVYPFVAYLNNQNGTPQTNVACTITAWPQTNFIIGVGTNLILSTELSLTSNVTGLITNNLAAGNYRMQIAGYSRGITFSIVSNSVAQNLAQVAGVPVVTFMNFTLAQFSDAGTMAYEATNNWTRKNLIDALAALGYTPATNSFAGIVAALGYTPATNSHAGIAAALTYTPATNTPAGLIAGLTYTPATNTPAGLIAALTYTPATNTPSGLIAALTYTPATNTPAGLIAGLTYTPATNTSAGLIAGLKFQPMTNAFGLNSNLDVIIPGSLTNRMYFTNGILMNKTL